MKKGRILLALAVSAVLAFAAFQVANNWMQGKLAASEQQADMISVVVAATEIPFGTKIESTHIKMVPWPRGAVPQGCFYDSEGAVERIASQTIYPGELLLESRVVEHLGGNPLASLISEGKRAVAVRVDDVRGVAGFLLPGNRVDVMAVRKRGAYRGGPETRTILQDIKVLAVDQTASPEKNGPLIVRAVTLEVTQPEAEELARAMEAGKVQLTLRNPLDVTRAARAEPAVTETPRAREPSPPVRVEAPDLARVFVIRGVQISSSSTWRLATAQNE